jgi:hypothetical protein
MIVVHGSWHGPGVFFRESVGIMNRHKSRRAASTRAEMRETRWTRRTLHEEVEALAQRLLAASYPPQRGARNDYRYWKNRGVQHTKGCIARHLRAMSAQYTLPSALVLALQDYLHCLETSAADAEEETWGSRLCKRSEVERWKAEGEARVSRGICTALARLLHFHEPPFILHTLSLDGQTLLPLLGKDDRLAGKAHLVELALPGVVDGHTSSAPGRVSAPPRPDGLSAYQWALLNGLDETLAHHASALVQLEVGQPNADVLMLCLDRLLRHGALDRILLLAGTTRRLPDLKRWYAEWVSREDGLRLPDRYPAQDAPTSSQTFVSPVCIASLREIQLCTRGDQALPRGAFDAILIYDITMSSPVWEQVLAYFEAPYRIGFSSACDGELLSLFGGRLVDCETASSRPVSASVPVQPFEAARQGYPPLPLRMSERYPFYVEAWESEAEEAGAPQGHRPNL